MANRFTQQERLLVNQGTVKQVNILKGSENEEELKEVIFKIYQLTRKHHPDREGDLPALLRNYRGREQQLLGKLVEKPELLLRLKKSFEHRRNLAPPAEKVMRQVEQKMGPRPNLSDLPKPPTPQAASSSSSSSGGGGGGASGADLFASMRDSVVGSEAAPNKQQQQQPKPQGGLSDMIGQVFVGTGEGDDDDDEQATPQFAPRADLHQYLKDQQQQQQQQQQQPGQKGGRGGKRRVSVAMLAAGANEGGAGGAGDASSPGDNGGGGGGGDPAATAAPAGPPKKRGSVFDALAAGDIAAAVGGGVGADDDDESGSARSAFTASLKNLPKAEQLVRLEELPMSLFAQDPSLDLFEAGGSVEDRAALLMEATGVDLPSKGKLLEGMRLEEAALVLLEFKLRGDFTHVIGSMSRGAQLAIKTTAEGAKGNKVKIGQAMCTPLKKKKTKQDKSSSSSSAKWKVTLPPETPLLLVATSEAHLAKVLSGVPLSRAAALLLEMHRRSGDALVLDAMPPKGLSAVLAHLPPPERAGLLCTLQMDKCSECLRSMSLEAQVSALAEMSPQEVSVALAGHDQEDGETKQLLNALQAFLIKKAKRDAKKKAASADSKPGADGSKSKDDDDSSSSSKKVFSMFGSKDSKAAAAAGKKKYARRASTAATLNRFAENGMEGDKNKKKKKKEKEEEGEEDGQDKVEASVEKPESEAAEELSDDSEEEEEEEEEEAKEEGEEEEDEEEEDDGAFGLFSGGTAMGAFVSSTSTGFFAQASDAAEKAGAAAVEAASKTSADLAASTPLDMVGSGGESLVPGGLSAAMQNMTPDLPGGMGGMPDLAEMTPDLVPKDMMPDVDDLVPDVGSVALPSWAARGNDDDGDNNVDAAAAAGGGGGGGGGGGNGDHDDNEDAKSEASDATTNLSGVSEGGAGDGSVFDQMVWSFLMSGLPAEEQARYDAMDERTRKEVMGQAAAKKASGGGGGVGGAELTSAESIAAAKKQRAEFKKMEKERLAEEEKKKKNANPLLQSPWSVFGGDDSSGGGAAAASESGKKSQQQQQQGGGAQQQQQPKRDLGIIGNFLSDASKPQAGNDDEDDAPLPPPDAMHPSQARGSSFGPLGTTVTAFGAIPSPWASDGGVGSGPGGGGGGGGLLAGLSLPLPGGGSMGGDSDANDLDTAAMGDAEALRMHRLAIAHALEDKAEANRNCRYVDKLAVEMVTTAAAAALTNPDGNPAHQLPFAPAPVAPFEELPGYVNVEERAKSLYSSQDAKLLASKWGISVTEIKFIAHQIALLSPVAAASGSSGSGGSSNGGRRGKGVLDPRMVPHILNRLGYFDSLNPGILPKQARPTELPSAVAASAGKKGGGFDAADAAAAAEGPQVTYALTGQVVTLLSPVEVADCFGKAAFALAEAARFNGGDGDASGGGAGGSSMARVSLDSAASRGMTAAQVLAKDPLAALAPFADARLQPFLFVFHELVRHSNFDLGEAEAAAVASANAQGIDPASTAAAAVAETEQAAMAGDRFESRLLGRALRRVGFGRPTSAQAAKVKQYTGLVLPLPDDFHRSSSSSSSGEGDGASAAASSSSSSSAAAGPRFMGLFEFLCAVSVMLDPSVDPLATVQTETLPNGSGGDVGMDDNEDDEDEDDDEDGFKDEDLAWLPAGSALGARGLRSFDAAAASVEVVPSEVAERVRSYSTDPEAAAAAAAAASAAGSGSGSGDGGSEDVKGNAAGLKVAVRLAKAKAMALQAKVKARKLAEEGALKLIEPVGGGGGDGGSDGGESSGGGHQLVSSGAHALLLKNLFERYSEEFELHRRKFKVVNKGLRSLLRCLGCFPLESQLAGIRAKYGDLGLNLHFDQFAKLATRDLCFSFPLATPFRVLATAGSRAHIGSLPPSSKQSGEKKSAEEKTQELQETAAAAAGAPVMSAVQVKRKGSMASRSSLVVAKGLSRFRIGNNNKAAAAAAAAATNNNASTGGGSGPVSVVLSPEVTNPKSAASSSAASKDPLSNFAVGEVFKLEHAFGVYDYDRDGVLDQVSLRALLRRLHVNWSAKQFVRVTRGALGACWPDFDMDDFVGLLTGTSAHMVESKQEKKSGQSGRRVANHHAKILYSHFSVVWDLPTPQLSLIQKAFLDEEQAAAATSYYDSNSNSNSGGGGSSSSSSGSVGLGEGGNLALRTLVPRTRVRQVLSVLGVNSARVEASGLAETFEGSNNSSVVSSSNSHTSSGAGGAGGGPSSSSSSSSMVDFDELLGLVAHVVHLYGFIGNGKVDDPLTVLDDSLVEGARNSFFNLAIDPQTSKATSPHCLLTLRQLKLVTTDMDLDRALRLSGTMPQYRSGWMGWPAFLRLTAQLNHSKLKDQKLLQAAATASASASLQGQLGTPSMLGSKASHVSDIDKLRGELAGFVDDHDKFENYMDRLNKTYRILQTESSKVVPARPPEPEGAPLSKAEQRKVTSAGSFIQRSKTGSFGGSFKEGEKGGGSFLAGRSGSFLRSKSGLGSFTSRSQSGSFDRSSSGLWGSGGGGGGDSKDAPVTPLAKGSVLGGGEVDTGGGADPFQTPALPERDGSTDSERSFGSNWD